MKSLNESISSDQRTLYEDILFPKGEKELVQTTIEVIHTLIDPSFSEDIFHGCYEYQDSPLPQYSTMDPRQYPRGYCHIICGRVYTILKEHPIIREFQAKGGLFEHDYVVYQDRESPDIVGFTNVIRIGHKILDPDMREFHSDRPHPSLQDQNDSAYHPISYANFVDTAEKYWGSQLYSSIEILGPRLAQFFPFVDIDPSGMLAGFPIIHSDRIKESILDEGKEIQEFFQSDNSGVRIPDNQMVERFQEVFRCI